MNGNGNNDYFSGLVRELCKLPQETEWVEFKGPTTVSRKSSENT